MPIDNKYQIDLGRRLLAAFGKDLSYVAGVQVNDILNQPLQGNKTYSASAKNQNEPATTSLLGTPVFDQVQINEGAYTFPLDPMVDIQHVKKIIETEIQGGSEVVELISLQSSAIRIRGLLWNGDNTYPETQLTELLNTFRINEVLSVNSKIFNAHSIKSIYIKSINMPALEGFEDTQPYEIEAKSFKPVELEITENQTLNATT